MGFEYSVSAVGAVILQNSINTPGKRSGGGPDCGREDPADVYPAYGECGDGHCHLCRPEFRSRKTEKDTAGDQAGHADTAGLLCCDLGSAAGTERTAGTDCSWRSPAGNQCRRRPIFIHCELPVHIPRLFDGLSKYSPGNGLQLSRHHIGSLGTGGQESGRMAGCSWRRFYGGLPGKPSGLDICSVLLHLSGETLPEKKRKKTRLDLERG